MQQLTEEQKDFVIYFVSSIVVSYGVPPKISLYYAALL